MKQPISMAMRALPLLALLASAAHAQHPRLLTTAALEEGAVTMPLQDSAGDTADIRHQPTAHIPPGPQPAAAPAYQAYPPSAPLQVGDATRNLIRLQASGQSAAPALPMLGQASSAAYQRYLKTFTHTVPEFFDTTVSSSGSGGSR